MTSRLAPLLISEVLIALAGCANDSAPPSPPGATTILLTDAPFPYKQVARVDVYRHSSAQWANERSRNHLSRWTRSNTVQ